MKLNKANLAGLTSPGQQSEMKSILAGTWPALKPLPVFKYETEEYRATISFDKKRGEWVCRKTSLPSNEVQELRGGLREITMALPHAEPEVFPEGAEPEQDLERDAYRRLQAIREWKEKYQNGARYFELQEFLSEPQRIELDDSLKLSLTARQLQFNPKNAADVFDDLSIAGGRFAALIEFAMRNKANQGIAPPAPGDGAAPESESTVSEAEHALPEAECAATEVESAPENGKQPLEIILPEVGAAVDHNDSLVPPPETVELCTGAEEFPALSIKNVFPEQELTPLAERNAHTASQQFGIEDSDIDASEVSDEDPPSLAKHSYIEHFHAEPSHAEPSHKEQRPSPVFPDFAPQVPAGQLFEDHPSGSSPRFRVLKISAFQANVFAILFLFAVTSFTVGLTVGRGPFGKRLREAPKSLLAADAKPPAPTFPDLTQPDAADESSSQAPSSPPASSDDPTGAEKPDASAPSEERRTAFEEKPNESPQISDSAETRSTDADSSPAKESTPSVEPEVNPEPATTIGPIARNASPHASHKLVRPNFRAARRPKAASKEAHSIRSATRTPAPYRMASAIAATTHPSSAAPPVTRSSTILVTLPDGGSQPFRVSFPNKTIAATSSLAMTAQLSVLVPPEPRAAVAHKSARLEAGEVVSYVWPRYSEPRGRYGLAETIRVRATIGQFGEVQKVNLLGGSASLLPATTEAIRQWRYTPTLLDKRPVQVQEDITIEFRPPQYSARLSTQQHPPHN